jgi:hypothetical protein
MSVDAKERAAIDKWIQVMHLDRFGNKEGTMYAGGNPAFNMRTGEMTDRYEFIVAKHPTKPWEPYDATEL